MSYSYKPYRVGKHSVNHMVFRFYYAKTRIPTFNVVSAAFPDKSPNERFVIAAYVWYHRSNRRRDKFSTGPGVPYQQTSQVYTVDPTLLHIRPATLTKYAALLGITL